MIFENFTDPSIDPFQIEKKGTNWININPSAISHKEIAKSSTLRAGHQQWADVLF